MQRIIIEDKLRQAVTSVVSTTPLATTLKGKRGNPEDIQIQFVRDGLPVDLGDIPILLGIKVKTTLGATYVISSSDFTKSGSDGTTLYSATIIFSSSELAAYFATKTEAIIAFFLEVKWTVDGLDKYTQLLTINIENQLIRGDESMAAANNEFKTLTDAATVVWAAPKGSNMAKVTLAGNRTLSITGAVAGASGRLFVKQDATGSRTLTLPAGSKVANGGVGAISITATANAVDQLDWSYDGTNYFWSKQPNFT